MVVIRSSDRNYQVLGTLGPSFEATPVLDQQYLRSMKSASQAATTEKYSTKQDSEQPMRLAALGNAANAILKVEKHAVMAKDEFEARKDEIEGLVFEAFAATSSWSTQNLAKKLKLNKTQVTSILNNIAIKIKTGPNRNEWTLKPEYQQGNNETLKAIAEDHP